MSLHLISPPGTEPVSIDEARAQCSADGTALDTLLTLYIQAARELCEKTTGRALITQTWEQRLDAFPAGDIELLKQPVQSIAAVIYIDAAGAQQTLSPALYVLDTTSKPWLLPAAGTSWPATAAVINAVRIQFSCGYGAAAAVPAPLKHWMLAEISTANAQRESVDIAGRASALPGRLHDSKLDPFIVY